MRLFVAIDLDDDARVAVGRAAGALRARLEQNGIGRASWVRTENLHFTVRFLGELDDGRANKVRTVLAVPFDVAPFEAAITHVGVFPAGARPRVLWLGVSEGADAMGSLHARVESRLTQAGLDPEGRGFAAHLTLARFRDFRAGSRAIVEERLDEPIRSRIDHVTLYQSRLSQQGSKYTTLLKTPLTGPVP
jgi:2'-5' RNA ligase